MRTTERVYKNRLTRGPPILHGPQRSFPPPVRPTTRRKNCKRFEQRPIYHSQAHHAYYIYVLFRVRS